MWRLPWIAASIWSALERAVLVAAEDAADRDAAIEDGTYWQDSVADDRDFPVPIDPDVDFGGGE